MKFAWCIILAILDFGFIMVQGDDPALCETWDSIVQKLRKKSILISCTPSSDCYGVNCTGAVQGYDISSWIQLHGCENPPYVEFDVHVPKVKTYDIKEKLYHNDLIHLNRNINLEFKLERKGKELVFELIFHFLNMDSFMLSVIPIISDLRFPINCELPAKRTSLSSNVNKRISLGTPLPSESKLKISIYDGYSNCSIINSTCNEEEICQQTSKLKPDGICVCITNYTRNEDGKCVHNQAVDDSSVSLLLTAILVPIFVVLILGALVTITIRFRIFQHLRRRLRVQVYEHVLLGEDEDETTTNPVI